ncbi:nuclear transport factor 2 family protein [Methylophilus aquaticus]|uniref:Tetratricopeptide repeat protein n=1 Tax=Methylophilus aquaticus TaxID=1971610 RepID=A0ABT9JQ99_9PROT|nr:tetratricopeptide repeat protein [Methylophilus aquaticus]MDP8566731.1 tetratricopeptide repeat protein [Methylophilus aquaticus]
MNATLIKYLLAIAVGVGQGAVFNSGWAGQATNVELREINQLSEQGNQVAALDRVNSYLAANPKNAEAMFMRGVIMVELGKRDEAIKAFTDLTDKYPNLPEPYNNLAVLYADQGQYDKARKALESAIKTHPSYATAHENLGDIYARLASEAYDKALKLDTSNTRAQSKLSMITDLFGGKRSVARTAPAAVNPPAAVTPPAATAPASNSPPASTTAPVVVPPPVVAEAKKPQQELKSVDNSEQAVLDAVHAWAEAWSSQHVDRYLDSYAKSFKTPGGESRQQWESVRRDRVSRPSKISVKLNNVEVKMNGDSAATVYFRQVYKATGLDANSNKTLNMVKEGSRWVIKQERVGRF